MTFLEYIIVSPLRQKIRFFAWFFVVFTLTYAILFALDWLPEAPADASADEFSEVESGLDTEPEEETVVLKTEYPREISIPSLNKTVSITNTASSEVADLDADLLKGTVRHPQSALLGEDGNIFILGHSSYLPTVFNKNFQAFNGIQNLVWGDTIVITSDTTEYVYQVNKVYKAKASALTVPMGMEGKHLTLTTCNSFGSVDDRYIVEAELVDTRPLL
jgi:LPXTG-site transpeptidase (sortase) family protein